jgi:hypothetical protein
MLSAPRQLPLLVVLPTVQPWPRVAPFASVPSVKVVKKFSTLALATFTLPGCDHGRRLAHIGAAEHRRLGRLQLVPAPPPPIAPKSSTPVRSVTVSPLRTVPSAPR